MENTNYYTGFNTSQFNIADDGEWVYSPASTNTRSDVAPPPSQSRLQRRRPQGFSSRDQDSANSSLPMRRETNNNTETHAAYNVLGYDCVDWVKPHTNKSISSSETRPIERQQPYIPEPIAPPPPSTSYLPEISESESLVNNQPIEVDEHYSASTLKMSEAVNGELYLSIPSVFKYVTLGGRLTEENKMALGIYVIENNHELRSRKKVLIQKINPITGECKEINIKKYGWSDYGLIAKACLDWAHENSQRIAY